MSARQKILAFAQEHPRLQPWLRTVMGSRKVEALKFVPEKTREGFVAELVPELERLKELGLPKIEAAQEMFVALNAAFAQKDMLYNILIRYQSSFENDSEFQESLEGLVESWAIDSE